MLKKIRYKQIIGFCFFLLCNSYISLGLSIPDSLVQLPLDTNKVLAYLECANNNKNFDLTLSEECIDSCIVYAKLLEYEDQLPEIYKQKGIITGRTNRKASVPYFELAIALAAKKENYKVIASCQMNLGICYNEFGDPNKSIEFLKKSSETWRQAGIPTGEIAVLLNLAGILEAKGKYEQAQEHLLKAEKLLIKEEENLTNTSFYYAAIYNLMGGIHRSLKDFYTAIDYFKKSISYFEENDRRVNGIFANLGGTFVNVDELDSARIYLARVLINDPLIETEVNIHHELGNLSLKEKNPLVAIDHFKKGLVLARDQEMKHMEALFLSAIGIAYFKNEDYHKSYIYLNDADPKLKVVDHLSQYCDTKEYLISTKLAINKYVGLEEDFEEYLDLRDSIYDEDMLLRIQDLKTKYETRQKEDSIKLFQVSELANQHKLEAKENENFGLGIGLFSFFCISGVLFFLFRNRQKKSKELQSKNQHIKTLIKEIQHRVKNNLIFIASLLDLQAEATKDLDAKSAIHAARERIEAMGILHKQLLYKEDLIATVNIQNYLKELLDELEKIHTSDYGKQLYFETEIEEISMNIEQALPVGLIVNELVANAVEHAETKDQILALKISLTQNGRSKLIVQDNGRKQSLEGSKGGKESFGLRLVNMLTHQLKGEININDANGKQYEIIFDVEPTNI